MILPAALRRLDQMSRPGMYTGAGRRFDTETGVFYYRHRVYAAELGRFVSRDAIESADALYSYTGGNPVGFMDPLGLDKCPAMNGKVCARIKKSEEWAPVGKGTIKNTGAIYIFDICSKPEKTIKTDAYKFQMKGKTDISKPRWWDKIKWKTNAEPCK